MRRAEACLRLGRLGNLAHSLCQPEVVDILLQLVRGENRPLFRRCVNRYDIFLHSDLRLVAQVLQANEQPSVAARLRLHHVCPVTLHTQLCPLRLAVSGHNKDQVVHSDTELCLSRLRMSWSVRSSEIEDRGCAVRMRIVMCFGARVLLSVMVLFRLISTLFLFSVVPLGRPQLHLTATHTHL